MAIDIDIIMYNIIAIGNNYREVAQQDLNFHIENILML